MPANSAGRMYFYLGTPNGPYFDFIEFTIGASSINVDTTRVDRFGPVNRNFITNAVS